MNQAYQWIVFAHLLGIFGFLTAHGASAAIVFKLRSERSVARIHAFLDLARASHMTSNISLLVLSIAGISLGFMGHWWGQFWIWTSLVLFVLIGTSMAGIASPPHNKMRVLVATIEAPGADTGSAAVVAAEKQLAEIQMRLQPILLTLIGGGGMALILWLMIFKPF